MNNELKNSESFINQKVGKKTGFTVSSNYFEEIENNFSIRLFEENNNKKAAFETPLNYFGKLEDTILGKIKEEKAVIKVITFKQRVLKMIPLAAAASVVLFIAINSFNFNKPNPVNFDSITDAEIENWLESNSNNINQEDIATAFSDGDLIDTDFAFTNINDTNIENYIYSNDDLTILNELY